MLIACKCLNLIVSNGSGGKHKNSAEGGGDKSESSLNSSAGFERCNAGGLIKVEELQKIQQDTKIHSKCLEFLKQANGPLTDIAEMIALTDLLYEVPLEPWTLYFCINCNTITHARNTSDSTYLINSTLLTNNEEINSIRSNQSYSKNFGILINPQRTPTPTADSISDSSNDPNNIIIRNKMKQQLQPKLKKITQQFNNALQKEIYDTDERIRRYTEQQFALLKSYREKAEQEYQILVSIVIQVPEQFKVIEAINDLRKSNPSTMPTPSSTSTSTTSVGAQSLFATKQQQQTTSSSSTLDTPPATPDSTPMSIGNSPTFTKQQQQTNIFGILSGRRGSAINSNATKSSGDASCLFEIEGMETYQTDNPSEMSDVEETEDAEDALGELDEGMHIPRSSRRASLNMARSLPISIAAVNETKFNIKDLEDEECDEADVDIAASIKALAKSVHGDTVFGDLPRPRFSTQI